MEWDKLSRLSALRPVLRPSPPGPAEAGAGGADLASLVAGEARRNDRGEHLAVRASCAGAGIREAGEHFLRVVSPGAAREAADPGRWLLLDTETTGLAGGTGTYPFLVGLGWWQQDGLVIEQLFMRDYVEEASLLSELSRRIEERPVLVTYNGRAFDWPLLETRFRITRAAPVPRIVGHLDLLHPARQIWRYILQSFAQSEVERGILGIARSFDIPSSTIPQRYFDFLRGGPAEPIAEVFRHNRMDLEGLAALAGHLVRLLENPLGAALGAQERYGVSRILRRRGELPLAGLVCREALVQGLPEEPGRHARQDLARDARKKRDFAAAELLLRELLDGTRRGLEAYEQLAILYEHRTRESGRAAVLAREALVRLREEFHAGSMTPRDYQRWHGRFQHRLTRLTRKECADPGTGAGPAGKLFLIDAEKNPGGQGS